jgi:hypothetical protein
MAIWCDLIAGVEEGCLVVRCGKKWWTCGRGTVITTGGRIDLGIPKLA